MNRSGEGNDPEDVDTMFAEIASDLRAQGVGQRDFRIGSDTEGELGGFDARDPSSTAWRTSESEWEDVLFGDDPAEDDEDEHYVPPEPPPLPKPRRGAFIVVLFFVLGLLLLIAPSVLGLPDNIGMPLGLLSLTTGIGLLLLRIRRGPPEGSDSDDGAQV